MEVRRLIINITGIILNALKFIMKGIIILLCLLDSYLTCITVGSNTRDQEGSLLLFASHPLGGVLHKETLQDLSEIIM